MCILTDRITFSLPIYVSKVVISVNILERGEFEVGGIRFFFFSLSFEIEGYYVYRGIKGR